MQGWERVEDPIGTPPKPTKDVEAQRERQRDRDSSRAIPAKSEASARIRGRCSTQPRASICCLAYIVGAGLIIGTPTLIFFGWLSDHIGRKPVILGGMLIAAVTYYPLYLWLGSVTQPGNINMPVAIIIVAILVAYVGMVYGPIGAFLGEFFPSRIRYT